MMQECSDESGTMSARKRLPRSPTNHANTPLSPLRSSRQTSGSFWRDNVQQEQSSVNSPESMNKEMGGDGNDVQGKSDGMEAIRDKVGLDLSRYTLSYTIAWFQRLGQTFGTNFIILLAAVYGAQGFKSFSSLALSYFLKDELKLEPAYSQALSTIIMFPWGIKPLYGILSDSLPIYQYHRKSYLMICSFVGCFCFILLSMRSVVASAPTAVIVLLLSNLAAATIDVVIDARVVEMSRLDPISGANDLQTISWSAMALGGIFGSVLSGPATHYLGVRVVFFLAALGPALILALSIQMSEQKSSISSRLCINSATQQCRNLKAAFRTPVIWKCALWIFLSGAVVPGFSGVTFYYVTEFLKFTPEFLGTIHAFGHVFLLVGTLLYNSAFKDLSFRRIFLITQLSLAVISTLDIILVTRTNLLLGIPDQAFVLGDAVISDVIYRLKTMPMLVLCSKLCPKGVEGTMFASLMSISNFSSSVSEFWGAFLCAQFGITRHKYGNLWLAVTLRSMLKVVPILFLYLIPVGDPQLVVDNLNLNCDEDTEDSSDGTIRYDHVAKHGSPDSDAASCEGEEMQKASAV